MLTKEQKKVVLAEMVAYWKNSKSFVFYNFEKMQATEITNLRKKVNSSNSVAFVVKNTLILLSAKEAGLVLDQALADSIFQGQTGIVVSLEDPLAGPKVIDQYYNENRKPEIKGGFFDGRLLTKEQITVLATIPSREVLNQRLAYDLLAPVTMFACSLKNTVAKFVFAINAVKELKEKSN